MIGKSKYLIYVAGVCCLATAFGTPISNGDDDTPPQPDKVDQRLLDGLDDLVPQRPGTSPRVAGEDLGAAQPQSSLAGLARLMQGVERRLRRNDTSEETQQLQSDIAAELAKMLKTAEQENSRQSATTASEKAADRSRKSNPDGSDGDRQAGNADRADEPSDLLEAVWGTLPERLRQQIQSPLQEEFLPRYERVIKQYYKRLAEEQRRLRD